MQLRSRKLKASDEESATFGRNYMRPRVPFNLKKVVEMEDFNFGSIKNNRQCQVRRDCQNPVVGHCIEQEYRGCTLTFCEEHSGQVYRQRHEWICCRPCARDKHIDICQECSSEILNARFKFYVITLILSMLIFFMLLYLVHLTLRPNIICREDNQSSQSLCGTIKQSLNSLIPYRKNAPSENLNKANSALHMFNQVDSSK